MGCDDPANFLEGSLASQYDLSFDSVESIEFIQSRVLHIEYVRSLGAGEEKPLMVTISPTPEGPGSFVHGEGGVSIRIDNSLSTATLLPETTSAEVELDAFTPGELDSTVRGSIHAMFTNSGAGDAFNLEGAFETTLRVQP